MKPLLYFPLLVLLAGCEPAKPTLAGLHFVAGACKGTCPEFFINIYSDHTAWYSAAQYNERIGSFETTIKDAQLDSLTQLLYEAGLGDLNESYETEAVDRPTYQLSVTYTNGLHKTIHDYGPRGPVRLKNVYRFIFSLRQSQDCKPTANK